MAERHPPSFNPFKKDSQVPVENTVNQRAQRPRKMRNGRKNRKKRFEGKAYWEKNKDRDWSMFGEFQILNLNVSWSLCNLPSMIQLFIIMILRKSCCYL